MVPVNGRVTEVTKESEQDPEERIVGGRNATCEEFPHQVSFVVNNSYFCGGFIISEQHILTAAHCAQNVDPSTVVMRTGSTWRKNGTKVIVAEVIPYPEYNNPPYDKDVAVMKLAEPLEFDACTKPIALPSRGLSARYGETITVSGWGRTKQGVTMIPDRLMAVNLTIVNHTLCRAAYIPLTITENMLCAGNFFLGGQSTCQGDSGGIGSIENVARGIVSFGRGCVFNKYVEEGEVIENESRIVGGQGVTCEQFPHQVNFVVNNSYFCGGFIIHERFILTAAHCAQNVDPSTVVLRSGSTYRNNGTVVPIAEVIPYPKYNDPPFDKDIAVFKTAVPIEFNSCAQPIQLPKRGFSPLPGSEMTVSGWGRTRQGATKLPERLMATNLTIVHPKMCSFAYPMTITKNMLCAGNFFFGGTSACQGDSGGVGAVDGVARGIVSFGRICGQPFAPSVFTDISAPLMRDFITTITGL
ncbi:transmembrane protease serine 9-like [Battus philenor]|uniref:transmembrane protease serine 9-like n=1 Tax=Battus philenor TaxID=42288 RepID=UPI0035D07474